MRVKVFQEKITKVPHSFYGFFLLRLRLLLLLLLLLLLPMPPIS